MGDGSAFGRERVAQRLRHDLGVTEIAHEPLLCISEREMSGACVADSFARAKGPEADRYIHHTPGGAQAAGCTYPSENVRPRVRVCQSWTMLRFPGRKQTRPATRAGTQPETELRCFRGDASLQEVNQTRRLAGAASFKSIQPRLKSGCCSTSGIPRTACCGRSPAMSWSTHCATPGIARTDRAARAYPGHVTA